MFWNRAKQKNTQGRLYAPISGTVISISDVNDEVFSQKILGDGVAIQPSDRMVCSPVDGRIEFIADTLHGFGIITNDGVQITIHIGIDTLVLHGEGFDCKASVGQKVHIGTPLCLVDFDLLKSKGCETDVIMVVSDETGEKMQMATYLDTPAIAAQTCVVEYTNQEL